MGTARGDGARPSTSSPTPLRRLSAAPSTLSGMRILVVDDDRAVRESLRRSLAFNGYQVDLAVDGKDALEAVQQRRPDSSILSGPTSNTPDAARPLLRNKARTRATSSASTNGLGR